MTSSSSPKPDEPGQDLVFLGTVTEIKPISIPNSRIRWMVTATVDRVLSGQFSEKTFSFGIHSPTKSGLAVGKQYEIRATWTGQGYAVDELQWLPRRP